MTPTDQIAYEMNEGADCQCLYSASDHEGLIWIDRCERHTLPLEANPVVSAMSVLAHNATPFRAVNLLGGAS